MGHLEWLGFLAAALIERSSLHSPLKPGECFWAIYVDGSGGTANLASLAQEALATSALEGKYTATEEVSFSAEGERNAGESAAGWGFAVFERRLAAAGDSLDSSMATSDRLAGHCCSRVAVGEPPPVSDALAMACIRFLSARLHNNAYAELSGMIQALLFACPSPFV